MDDQVAVLGDVRRKDRRVARVLLARGRRLGLEQQLLAVVARRQQALAQLRQQAAVRLVRRDIAARKVPVDPVLGPVAVSGGGRTRARTRTGVGAGRAGVCVA